MPVDDEEGTIRDVLTAVLPLVPGDDFAPNVILTGLAAAWIGRTRCTLRGCRHARRVLRAEQPRHRVRIADVRRGAGDRLRVPRLSKARSAPLEGAPTAPRPLRLQHVRLRLPPRVPGT